jgi:predicted Zn-dependent peptidase
MWRIVALVIFLASSAAASDRIEHSQDPPTTRLAVPVEFYSLPNGMRVVLAPDRSIPTVTVGTYYHIGFRIEPRNRTGFAHLFEHLMFQETPNLAKGEADRVISGNGGLGNGSTRFDYTNYYEVVPSNVLAPALFVEADRMRGLAISPASIQNQKDVVKNEVRVNVLNRPYGGFPWLELPQAANTNWFNAHNFYGELDEIDAATFDDVKAFYDTYYVPANAVLVVAGDFDIASAKTLIADQFSALPNRPAPPHTDVTEPQQRSIREKTVTDPLAPRPAVAFGYHVPPRQTDDWYAFALLDVLLLQGEESRLWQRLVTDRGYSDAVEGGVNLLGNPYDYEGPMLWSASLLHDPTVSDQQIAADVESVIAELRNHRVQIGELDAARTKIRSALYDVVGSPDRFGLIGILATGALFDNDPNVINHLEERFASVTPQQIQSVARRYLAKDNLTILHVLAGASGGKP